jgi:hypothetical protein
VVLASSLGFSALYRTAGDRKPVLVAARDIGRYEQLSRDDVRIALVAAEPGVATVPANNVDSVVGRLTLTDISQGSVLAPGQMATDGQQIVGQGEAVVGARLEPGAAPVGDIAAGTRVLIVIRPGSDAGDTELRQVAGWLEAIEARNPNTGSREASLVVPQENAAAVAAAAADGRIAIVGLEGG